MTNRSRLSLWLALAALAVGVIVAVLGVRSAITSNERHQKISKYASARSTAVYFVKNGNTISVSMKRLQALNSADLGLMKGMRAAVDITEAVCITGYSCPSYDAKSQATATYNTLKNKANAANSRQSALRIQVEKFQAAFKKTLAQS